MGRRFCKPLKGCQESGKLLTQIWPRQFPSCRRIHWAAKTWGWLWEIIEPRTSVTSRATYGKTITSLLLKSVQSQRRG